MRLLRARADIVNPGCRSSRPAVPHHGRASASTAQSRQNLKAAVAAERGVLILPGLGNSGADYTLLKGELEGRGFTVEVADVARVDWLRNAAGVVDLNYWKGTLQPRPTVDWYLNKVDAARTSLRERVSGSDVPTTMLTHSAGGWLGRVYLMDFGIGAVDRLVSLGSPHNPPPEGVVDQTRGILTFCDSSCPACYHEELTYVSVASKFLKGARLRGPGTLAERAVGAGYQQVCGSADVWGDGIVPVATAHLDGATNLTLDGVYHSPLGASAERPWYGSPEVIDQWIAAISGQDA